MSWSLVQDGKQKLESRKTEVFRGVHTGIGRTDAPEAMAHEVSDLLFSHDDARLRPGMRRNESYGYPGDVSAIFGVRMGGRRRAGIISGGSLDVVEVSSIMTGMQSFILGDPWAQEFYTAWRAIADGSFSIQVDGLSYNVTGLDFSAVNSMHDVAAIIQAAIQFEQPPRLLSGSDAETDPAVWQAIGTGQFDINIEGERKHIWNIDFSAVSTMAHVAGFIQAAMRKQGVQVTVAWDSSEGRLVFTGNPTLTFSSIITDGGFDDPAEWDLELNVSISAGLLTFTPGGGVYGSASQSVAVGLTDNRWRMLLTKSATYPTDNFWAAFLGDLRYNYDPAEYVWSWFDPYSPAPYFLGLGENVYQLIMRGPTSYTVDANYSVADKFRLIPLGSALTRLEKVEVYPVVVPFKPVYLEPNSRGWFPPVYPYFPADVSAMTGCLSTQADVLLLDGKEESDHTCEWLTKRFRVRAGSDNQIISDIGTATENVGTDISGPTWMAMRRA